MPRLVDSLPPRYTKEHGFWDQYLDGLPRAFTRGIDFTGRPRDFATNARGAGRRRGLTVATRVRGDVVYVQANPPARALKAVAS